MAVMKELDEITGEIVDAAVKLHQRIGPGLLESVYQALLAQELIRRRVPVEPHKRIAQVLTYLRLLDLPVGLLINFGANTLKDGLHRIVNNLPATASPGLRVNQVRRSGDL
jgi:iron complex transport system substrate-binding protein